MQKSLILRPELKFSEIAETFDELGWDRSADTAVTPPIVSGEPEMASWSRGTATVSYTFNPVVNLRVAVFYGVGAELNSVEVSNAVGALGSSEIRALLESDDVREILLGIFAAKELRSVDLLDPIQQLLSSTHQIIATAASQAQADIIASQFTTAIEEIQDEKRRHPERSVLFSRLGDADTRRQTLRWLIHDFPESNEHITEVLRSALVDADWEVRVTAMLAVAHFGARELLDDVQALDVTSAEHSDEDIFLALRASVVDELKRAPGTGGSNETSPNGEAPSGLSQNLHRLIWSVDKRFADRAQTLIPMLTLPLPEDEEADHG